MHSPKVSIGHFLSLFFIRNTLTQLFICNHVLITVFVLTFKSLIIDSGTVLRLFSLITLKMNFMQLKCKHPENYSELLVLF